MAAKRIFKFILKMLVAAGIVVGAYFGISALVNKGGNPNSIIDASNKAEITTKMALSHKDLESSQVNLQTKIDVLDKINVVLTDYYNYYLTLTPYKNYQQNKVTDGVVIDKINELKNQIEVTTRYMAMTINVSDNASLKEQRVLLTAKEYEKQTKLLFEVDELLKQYVYESNYNLNGTGIVYEVQLEMIKDYSKAIFNFAIKDNIDYSIPDDVLREGDNNHTTTSFIDVVYKFTNRQTLAVNGNVEVSFVQFYGEIDKMELNSFYLLNQSEKQTLVNSILDETKKMYFDSLLQYLKQEHI